jgi:hypothetical protein
MRQETVAVSADLCRLVFPDQNRIRALLTGVESKVTRLSLDLRKKLQAVIDATNIEDWNAPRDRILRDSLEALREACGSRMLACLIAWPASM